MSGIESVIKLLRETFLGVEKGGTQYIDSGKNSGLFSLINNLSAEEVSKNINGTTIAAHVDHTRYHISLINESIKGNNPEQDWDKSWKIKNVNEDEWEQIKEKLVDEFNLLIENTNDEVNNNQLEFMSSLAHSAYHFGALKQMVKFLN